MDKLQVLQKLASDEPSSARIFKAIADPPTTSLQRLKVLAISFFIIIIFVSLYCLGVTSILSKLQFVLRILSFYIFLIYQW